MWALRFWTGVHNRFFTFTVSETLTRTEYDLNIFVSLNAVIVVLVNQIHYCVCYECLIEAQKYTSILGQRTK